jgi:hypothetical protein
MVQTKRGRPRAEGERYPGGKLKRPAGTDKHPIAPALWQRIKTDGIKLGLDPRLATELGRLGLHDELTASEVSAGFRIAQVYGRYEYFHGRTRSAGGSAFFKLFVADLEPLLDVKDRDPLYEFERERAEEEAKAEFQLLQEHMPPSHRAFVEQLCVENQPINPYALRGVKIVLQYFAKLFADDKRYRARQAKKLAGNDFKMKVAAPKKKASAKRTSEPASELKPARINKDKTAWLKIQRILRPDLSDEELEKAWRIYNALKAREDFRDEKVTA